ncbi:glycosyltransferase [Paenibacillus sp. tmac-D7]|uniref:glycosyltransferase family 2 protein n=1 Tax=Paenibacillus sp. tmac-D7 TaxID=2591462 RepID=UPI00215B14FB|nr:glycosyltransferase [Paenibacillus sp. tmac-D7]
MELFKALIHSGITTKERVQNLKIHLYNSSGLRKVSSQSVRFLVFEDGKPLCAVKKIPLVGLYDLESMLKVQKSLHNNPIVCSPNLYGTFNGTEHLYIVEELIDNPNLEDLVLNESCNLSITSVLDRIYSVFQKELRESELDAHVETTEWLTAAKMIGLNAHHIKILNDEIIKNYEYLMKPAVMTSRDILLKNIIIKEDLIYLVDFDLSRKTSFLWIDLLRTQYYSPVNFDPYQIKSLMPLEVDGKLLKIIFLLSELYLQSQVFDEGYLPSVTHKLKSEILPLFDELFNTDLYNEWIEGMQETVAPASTPNVESYIQLYWSNAENNIFTEENSSKQALYTDNDWHQYLFELNIDQISMLRLDPADQQGIYEIRKLQIISSNDSNLDLLDMVKTNGELQLFTSQEGIGGFSWTNDPQLIVELHNVIQEGPYKVLVEIKVSNNLSPYLNKTYEYELIIDNLNRNLSKQENEYQLAVREHQQVVREYQEAIQEQKLQTEAGRLQNTKLRLELDTIKNTRSWRWTSIIRRGTGQLRALKSKLLGEKSIHLVPLQQLHQKTEDIWKSTGDDPQFIMNNSIRSGWVHFSFSGTADQMIALKLYYDLGQGMSEENSVILGILSKSSVKQQSAFFQLPKDTQNLRLDPGDKASEFSLFDLKIRPISKFELSIRPVIKFFVDYGFSFSTLKMFIVKSFRIFNNEGIKGLSRKAKSFILPMKKVETELIDYNKFVESTTKSKKELDMLRESVSQFNYLPVISVLVPVYNVEERWLRRCIDSVVNQVYPYWELCLVDDCSSAPHIQQVLNEYRNKDSRIKVLFRETNGHICAASNDALNLATGEFVALLDHDDELTPDALYENMLLLNEKPDADVIYSDEDKISIEGNRHSPFFKPDWSPDTFLSQMYTCHLTLYRKKVIDKIGGFRVGFEGSQDYDLMLRVSEVTQNIYHIPKVLYHWREIPESTASGSSAKNYTHEAGLRALEEALKRRNIDGWVEGVEDIPNLYRVHYKPIGNPKVSIIIPTRNMATILEQCLNSIFDKTTYDNFEVIIVDNGSDEPDALKLFEHWRIKEPIRFKVLTYDIPFNYSKINNFAAQQADGELLLLLNNDVEVITPNWLEEMIGQAIRKEIGAVGACLYYPDKTIQHAGIVLGLGGVAGHSHKHFPSDATGYFCRLKMVTNYAGVTAACLMIRKEVFHEVGGLEEELQVAFNDVDFCLKIYEKGYKNVWLPQVQLYHYESKSRGYEDTPDKQRRFQNETKWMRNKWANLLDRDPFYNPNLTKDREDFSLGKPFD